MNLMESNGIEFDISIQRLKQLSLKNLIIDLNDINKIYWVHCNLNQKDLFQKLIEQLKLPDDFVKLCLEEGFIPKVINTDETLSLQVDCLLSSALEQGREVLFSHLNIHLTSRYCFTASFDNIPILNDFVEEAEKSIPYAKTPCFILFLMMDNTINDYAKILYHFEVISDQMENHIHTTHENIYNDVLNVKQTLMKIKRNMISLREVLTRISGRNIAVISQQCRVFLHDLANHTHLIIHEVESVRDLLKSSLDQIDNILMQNLSESMRRLTIIASIFLPLSLIAGIYGMNFHEIPELSWKYGYLWALFLMASCAIIMLAIFKKNKWF